MANLQRTHHQLAKAEKKLRKYSRSQKQFQVQFVRKPKNGKFKTTAHIRRGEKSSRYAGHGLIHKAVRFKTRFTGDKPSVTKSLDILKPKTFRGKVLKRSAQLVNRTVHTAWHTAESTALGAETVTFKTTKAAERNVRYKLKQKYRQEAVDDYHRGTIATLGIAKDAVHGTRSHFKQKKQFKLEKTRYRLQKAEYKLFKGEEYRPKLAKSRKELKAEKRKFRERKKSFRRFKKIQSYDSFNAAVAAHRFQRRKKQYKTDSKRIKTVSCKLKKEKKFQNKVLRKQWRIADLSRPAPLVLKPANYTGKRLAASGWQKAVHADENNDFLSAVEAVKRHGVEKAVEKIQPHRLKERNQKKKEKLEKKQSDTRQRLQKREDKLKSKGEQSKRRKKPKKQTKDSFGDRLKNAIRQAFQFVKNIYNKEARAVLLACLVPILIIALVLAFILMIFSGILSGSGFVLGTYAAQDYDLSEAEKYYTKLAYDMNEKILKVSSDTDWKNGLAAFGANKRNLKDDPDNWYWGRSSVYDWDPVYDFDVYKLWSFLCAYYYDFDTDSNGDIRYWSYGGDTENLLNEIFNAEYEFVYWYDNRSRWEELSDYNYWGGGSAETGTYYRAEKDAFVYSGRPYKYRFKPIAYTSELSKYFDSEGYVCINADYRVLNPNDDYALTGFMIMDHRYYSGKKEPFYFIDNDAQKFFFMKGDTRYDRSFWGWNGNDAWFLVSPTDTHIWNDTIHDACMYGYYEKYDWKTECNLYYNVRQKKSFERVLEDKLKSQSHREERLEYYKLLAGQESGSETLYGNHQTLRNILPGDTIRNYSVKQAFGYDMWEWNQTNDGLYQGIKYSCNTGTRLSDIVKENKMGVAPVWSLLLKMSLPVILFTAVQALYNIVDGIFVAKISEKALSAITYAMPMYTILTAIGTGIAVGMNTMLSRALGEKNQKEVNDAASSAIFLVLLTGILSLLIGFTSLSGAFMNTQTADIEIRDSGVQYLRVYFIFGIETIAQLTFERMLISTGKTLYSMISQAAGAILNIIFDPILIFGLFGFPRMGITGAAVATVVSQIIAAVIALLLNVKKNTEVKLHFTFKPQGYAVRNVLYLGVPSTVLLALNSFMMLNFNAVLSKFSSTAVAVFGACCRYTHFFYAILNALCSTSIPVIAYNFGAKKKSRINETLRYGYLYSIIMMAVGTIVCCGFPAQLLRLFNATDEMIEIGVVGMRMLCILYMVTAIRNMSTCVVQALGHSIPSMLVDLSRNYLVLIPAAWLLSMTGILNMVWLSIPIADFVCAVVGVILIVHYYKKDIKPLQVKGVE